MIVEKIGPGVYSGPVSDTRAPRKGNFGEDAISFDKDSPNKESPKKQQQTEDEHAPPFMSYNNQAENQTQAEVKPGLDVTI